VPTYSAIPDSDVDGDSPCTPELFTLLRDNPIAMNRIHILGADQTYNNDATVNDTTMDITVVGGKTYHVHAMLAVTAANSGAGIRFKLVTPDPTNDVGMMYLLEVTDPGITTSPLAINADHTIDDIATAYTNIFLLDAYVTLDATPASGDIELWASQKDAHASNTVLEAESFMVAVMVDAT
jgi:hypothetical protein